MTVRRWLPLLVGGGVLAVALFAAGTFGSPSATTTTSTALAASIVDEALSGPTLVWEEMGDIEVGLPVAFGRSGTHYFLFTTAQSGVAGWRSDDLVTWEPLRLEGIDGADVDDVAIHDQGMVAIESNPAQPATVWTSGDGEVWTRHELPGGEDVYGPVTLVGVTWWEGRPVVYASVNQYPSREILAAMPSDLAAAVQEGVLAAHPTFLNEDGVVSIMSITVSHPMGAAVATFTSDDLGVDLNLGRPSRCCIIWTAGDDGAWAAVPEPPLQSLESLVVHPRRGLVAHGYGVDSQAMATFDGSGWQSRQSLASAQVAGMWDEILVARAWGSPPSIRASESGATWTQISPGRLFDDDRTWDIDRVAAGGLGLVASATGREHGVERTFPPRVLERDGYRIEFGLSWVLVFSGDELVAWPGPGGQQSRSRYDATTDAIVFLDPETGEDLVSLTWDDYRAAFVDPAQAIAGNNAAPLVLFTRDGDRWSAASPPWETAGFERLIVEDDRVLAAVPDATGKITIWQGRLP